MSIDGNLWSLIVQGFCLGVGFWVSKIITDAAVNAIRGLFSGGTKAATP